MKLEWRFVLYGLLIAGSVRLAALIPPVAGSSVTMAQESLFWKLFGVFFVYFPLFPILIETTWAALLLWSAWTASKRWSNLFARASALVVTTLLIIYVLIKVYGLVALAMSGGE